MCTKREEQNTFMAQVVWKFHVLLSILYLWQLQILSKGLTVIIDHIKCAHKTTMSLSIVEIIMLWKPSCGHVNSEAVT